MKYICVLFILFLTCFLLSCSTNILDHADEIYVAVNPHVVFQNNSTPVSPDSVDKIIITVSFNGRVSVDTFEFEDHSGTLSTKIPANTPFTLRIEGIDNNGNVIYHGEQVINGSSENLTITITASQVTPVAPENLEITTINETRVLLKWEDKSSNELGFITMHSIDNGFSYMVLDTVSKDKVEAIGTLNPTAINFYKVVAYNDAGISNATMSTFDPLEIAPTPKRPSGDVMVEVGDEHFYSTEESSCGNGHALQYRFDWGDSDTSNWSSAPIASHAWSEENTYFVKAQSRCAVNKEVVSAWSDSLSVQVIDNTF